MQIKIQKFIGILLALPIVFGFLGGPVSADSKVECATEDSCNSKIKTDSAEFERLEKIYNRLKDCVNTCQEPLMMSECSVQISEGVDKNCQSVIDEARSDTSESFPTKMLTELAQKKAAVGSTITITKIKLLSLKKVETSKVLTIDGQKSSENLESFFDKVIDLAVKMVGLAAFVLLLAGGFRLLVAAGNDNEIQKAKTMVTYSIIGLAVALLAYIIVAGAQGILYK